MPFRIQRVARGLGDLLSTFGGQTPTELEDRIRGTLDLTQLYGQQQRSVVALGNAALPEGTTISVLPSEKNWIVLFAMSLTVIKTATVTALSGTVGIRLNSDVFQEMSLRDEALGPFGATETGTRSVVHVCPYPMLLPPNTLLVGRLPIIGTDATANVVLSGLVGILG